MVMFGMNYGRKKFYEIGSWDCIHNTSFSSSLSNESNKLVLHYTRLKSLSSDNHFILVKDL